MGAGQRFLICRAIKIIAPYTIHIVTIASAPSHNAPGAPLYQIAGMTPSLLNLKPGCAFRARCEAATDECAAPPQTLSDGRTLRCFHPLEQAIA